MQPSVSSGRRRRFRDTRPIIGSTAPQRTRQTPRKNTPKKRGQNKYIDPARFVNRAVERVDEPPYVATHSFDDFALNQTTKQTLRHLGFTTPSAIQDQAIEPALAGRDVIGLANTGTGKTAAFLLPIIERLSKNPTRNSVLILSPTRELAQQIDAEFKRFAAGQRLYSTICVGGVNIGPQIRDLKRNPHVIIATPGRLKDLIERRAVVLGRIDVLVLDEADRMLDMGFVRDIRRIVELLPDQRQTLFFSATITPEIEGIVGEFMRDPITISVRRGETSNHIDQDVIHARDRSHKIDLLIELLEQEEFEKTIVFCDTKHFAQRLSLKLTHSGISAEAIHGNKSQGQRERALRAFKEGSTRVLVATDVAARGLDISGVSHVINFDQPKVYEDYVHRIGRTGRAGKTGKALTFVTPR